MSSEDVEEVNKVETSPSKRRSPRKLTVQPSFTKNSETVELIELNGSTPAVLKMEATPQVETSDEKAEAPK